MVQPDPSVVHPIAAQLAALKEHYERQLEAARAFRRGRQAAFIEVVDFVEAHGGALSGEQRDELFTLCSTFAK
jgi:hypothetical protein